MGVVQHSRLSALTARPLPAAVGVAPRAARAARPLRLAICAAGEIWGGVEQFVLTLAVALEREGTAPVVILFHDGLLARRLRDVGVTVDVLPHGAGHHPGAVAELRRALRRREINLLHVHGYKAMVVGALASRGLGIKVVKTEHGRLERPAGWRDLPAFAKLWAYAVLDRFASSTAVDAVAFVSRDIAETAGRWSRRVPRRVIYNGLAPSVVGRLSQVVASDGAFNIGIVGRLTKVKGHHHLFNALARVPHLKNLKLHVFGTGPLEADYRRLAETCGVSHKVVFHGFEPAVQEKMAALDLLIIPSEHEGLPYVVLEAMHLQVPIVASRVGGLTEALLDGECGILVPPKDPAALASAIEHAYRDPELRRRIAMRAQARLRRDFLASVMVRQYAAMYRTVTGH